MTLNIGLFTREAIHIGADFRLTDADKGELVSDASPKLVLVREQHFSPDDWMGVFTYCGVGRWRERDTSQWLGEWIRGVPSPRSFTDVVSAIEREGAAWLAGIKRQGKYSGSHTFLAAAIVRGVTTVAVISNADRLHGPTRNALIDGLSSEAMTVSQDRILITGMRHAVVDADQHALQAALRRRASTAEVQRVIASAIYAASHSTQSLGTISPFSFTYSVNSQGDEVGHLHGEVPGGFSPLVIQNEVDMSSLLKSLVGAGAQIVPVSAASISSAHPREIEPCEPVNEFSANEHPYVIHELSNLGVLSARPHASNAQSEIVGEALRQMRGPPEAAYWSSDGSVQAIFDRSLHSYANDINESRVVAGTIAGNDGEMRAFVIDQGQLHLLETLGGMHGHGNAINNEGTVVGSSWTIPGNTPGDKRERAFIWTKKDGVRDLGALQSDWCSRAEDINDDGIVVGMSMLGSLSLAPPRAFVWDAKSGMKDIGALDGRGASPIAINAGGLVVGLSGRDSFVWSKTHGMLPAPLPAGSKVGSINDRGDMAYNRDTPRGVRPYLSITGVGEVALPVYKDHQSEVVFVDNNRCALGYIWAGRHSHAVRWLPKS